MGDNIYLVCLVIWFMNRKRGERYEMVLAAAAAASRFNRVRLCATP